MALTAAMYQQYGQQMQQLGYNTVLAPCADVNSNPDNPIIGQRAFGAEPALVSRHVRAAVQALSSAGSSGLCQTLPRSQRDGDTASDSQAADLPLVTLSRQQLLDSHLQPFIAAIAAAVPCWIMTSQIPYPALDIQTGQPPCHRPSVTDGYAMN